MSRGSSSSTFDTAQILDVTGPAGGVLHRLAVPPGERYRTEVVTARGGPVTASCGLEFASSPIGEVTRPRRHADGRRRHRHVRRGCRRELLHHVRRLAADARRVTSVCSGAFVLAAAGLLDGRRATTHWAACDLLDDQLRGRHRRPRRHLRPRRQRVDLGRRHRRHRPGARAGRRRPRTPAAATVARQLVVYLQRSGGQAQFSAVLAAQAADTEPVSDLLSWLRDHLTDDLSVAALARQINLSERQFSRVFKAEVGITAADHVEAVRLESACRLLETTNRTDRAGRQDLRLRHPRDHEPHLPPPPQHHSRRPPTPLPHAQRGGPIRTRCPD